ncbi:hypothetical protein HDU93_008922, partial [Gonapodya sp. JEL0774]
MSSNFTALPHELCAYVRTTLPSSVVKGIVPGKFLPRDPDDPRREFVLVKESRLELLEVNQAGDTSTLSSIPAFGVVKAARALTLGSLSFPDYKIGRDILVCTSDSGCLSLIGLSWLQDSDNADLPVECNVERPQARFVLLKEVMIAPPGTDYRDVGTFLCVDSMSRAIATLALQDNGVFFPLNTAIDDMSASSVCDLSMDGISFTETGIFWLASFLDYPEDEGERVCLATVVCKHGHFYVTVRVYDPTKPIEGLQQPIADVDLGSVPGRKGSFIVITEAELLVVHLDELLKGRSRPSSVPLPAPPRLSDRAHRATLITATTPISISSTFPHFYLSAESGHLFRAEFRSPRSIDFQYISKRSPTTNLATWSDLVGGEDREAADLLYIAGEMTDGEVLLVSTGSSQQIRLRQLCNLAPTNDARIVPKTGSASETVLLAACGTAPNGSVRDVRFGLAVSAGSSATADAFSSCNGIWSAKLDDVDDFHSFLVLSFTSETKVMQLLGDELEDITDESNLDTETATLCAGSLKQLPGWIFQVHTRGVTAGRARALASRPDADPHC